MTELTGAKPERLHLYRRKGNTAWATCSPTRFAELSRLTLFETREVWVSAHGDPSACSRCASLEGQLHACEDRARALFNAKNRFAVGVQHPTIDVKDTRRPLFDDVYVAGGDKCQMPQGHPTHCGCAPHVE